MRIGLLPSVALHRLQLIAQGCMTPPRLARSLKPRKLLIVAIGRLLATRSAKMILVAGSIGARLMMA